MPGPPRPKIQDLVLCRVCRRNFYKDRIAKHESICKNVSKKKHRVFDSAKQRVQGTEAEAFNRKAQKPKKVVARTNNWRQKHEEFIAAIRNAKKVQQHLAKGGKLKDIPPPPPSSENPDYIRCPSCNRTFNETAAARHIPRCTSYDYNKPKMKPTISTAKLGKKRF
ncbi:zinc finger C2HC domain-containing protein 1A [Sitodiplosis mosellana]|uniref:zinc finger C2HC domain-containing protein 1A n=1 Tax=Sitodiplosis mosellana TaxID=263140 RepID=UPI00244380D8|nr:zinc finger C2HC domain-containing protein 1A [Sitodiplosis mosellana]